MIARPGRPIGPMAWLAAPMAASLGASFVLALPLRVGGIQAPEPVFAFVPAFAWAMARPAVAPALTLVLMGLGLDFLWGSPPGLWPLCLLTDYTLIFLARRVLVGQEFLALWGAYAAAGAAALIVGLVLTGLRAGHLPSLAGVGWQFAVSAALFPIAWRLIERYETADARYR